MIQLHTILWQYKACAELWIFMSQLPFGQFNIKTHYSIHRDSYYKDKMVVRPSNLNDGNSNTSKMIFYIDMPRTLVLGHKLCHFISTFLMPTWPHTTSIDIYLSPSHLGEVFALSKTRDSTGTWCGPSICQHVPNWQIYLGKKLSNGNWPKDMCW